MPETSTVAGVVIRNEKGEYLLVQEKKEPFTGLWGFPGGHVDEGETPKRAAAREAQEEVDLAVNIPNDDPLLIAQLTHHNKTYHAFIAVIINGEVKIDPVELLDAKWLTLEEITAMDRAEETREPMVLQAVIAAEKA